MQPPVSGGGVQPPVSGRWSATSSKWWWSATSRRWRTAATTELAGPQGSTFIREDRTMPEYRLYSINDVHPAMIRVPANATNGVSVMVEIWCVPADGLATYWDKNHWDYQ